MYSALPRASSGEQPWPRIEAMSAAYVRWGLAQPGHYRVLFSATNAGPAGLGLHDEPEHPGAGSLRTLVDGVAACLASRAMRQRSHWRRNSGPRSTASSTCAWLLLIGFVMACTAVTSV